MARTKRSAPSTTLEIPPPHGHQTTRGSSSNEACLSPVRGSPGISCGGSPAPTRSSSKSWSRRSHPPEALSSPGSAYYESRSVSDRDDECLANRGHCRNVVVTDLVRLWTVGGYDLLRRRRSSHQYSPRPDATRH